jgi:TolB-like protein/Tfp pilus assembly protein PilF
VTLPVGTRLGPYEIRSAIGAGGMGNVYEAHDTRLDRTVAIKVLRPEAASDRHGLQRFEQEARAASALNHPNIVTIYDIGRDENTTYIGMELVEGVTVRELISRGRLPIVRLVEIARQLADGLAKAHAAHIVHRDLKPENVMVSADGFVKILDFGVAKLSRAEADSLTDTQTSHTAPGVVMGTVGYMSPELAAGKTVDYRADQFALGLIIYELATGKRPFERNTAAQTLAAIIESQPAPLASLNRDVPEHLTEVVNRCLAKDPADRYDSTRDLARDLKQIAEAHHTKRARRRDERPPRPFWWVAAVALVLVAIIGVVEWRRGHTTAAQPPLVAVLPFRNLSPDPAQNYFAAGITEEIHGQLSKIAALRLLSQAAAAKYQEEEGKRMARELGVASVVAGNVRVDHNRVRVAVEVVDPNTEQTRWSNQYDGELNDIFSVQSDIALHVARALSTTLSQDERTRVEKKPTQNLKAYQLYLRALDAETNAATIELLQKALALDPAFAAAKASLSYKLLLRSLVDGPKYLEQSVTQAEQAIRLDPSLAYGHFALASGFMLKGAAAQARLSFLRALELDPSHVDSMQNLSILEMEYGRLDEALYWARRAFLLSERGANDYYHLGAAVLYLRNDEESERFLTEAARHFPSSPRLQVLLTMLDTLRGQLSDALVRARNAVHQQAGNEESKILLADLACLSEAEDAEVLTEEWLKREPDSPGRWLLYETPRIRHAFLLQKKGDAAGAGSELQQAETVAHDTLKAGSESPGVRIALAAISLLKSDRASALDWLNRAYDAGNRDYGLLERDPILQPLHSDPQFRALLERMKSDVLRMRERAQQRGLMDLSSLSASSAPQ